MPASTEYLSIVGFTIKADGSEIATDLKNDIVQLVVDSNLHLPDMCLITFYCATTSTVDSNPFALGAALEVSVKVGSSSVTLFKGEVTALEPEFAEGDHVLLTVRGYDKSHRLHRGKKTRVFANMTYSDAVQQVVGEAGLSVSVESTTGTHPVLWQYNQTDMEFIQLLAQRLGYRVDFVDDTVQFKKYQATGSAVDLAWGTTLRTFRPRLSGMHQAGKAVVRGWDPKQKQAISGEKSSATSTAEQGGISDDGGAKAKQAFTGEAPDVVVTYPVLDASEAGVFAQARYDAHSTDYVQAEGVCIGNPSIKANTKINVTGVGTKFSGTYVIASAVHVYTPESGYETRFSVHGRHADTLADLLGPREPAPAAQGLSLGVVSALVTNTNDPDGKGRVKVKYPWLDDQLESDWIRFAAPGAGKKRGIYFIPEVNDEVLVAFEHGDFNCPYIVGALWNGQDEPPKPTSEATADGKTKERIIQSRSGHIIILSDEDGSEKIIIREKGGKNEIVIDTASNTITVKAEQDITIEGKGAVTVKSTNGDLTLEGNNLKIKAKMAVTMEAGSNLEIKASANCDIKANANCTIKGTAACTVEGSASLTLKDSAGAQIALTGPAVSINNGALDVI